MGRQEQGSTDAPAASRKRKEFIPDEHWRDHFAMLTRGFVEEFSLRLNRNAWAMYLTLATFYNRKQQRAYPTMQKIEHVCPLDRSSRSRALYHSDRRSKNGTLSLIDTGLVEVWSERVKRRRRTFFRLPHVDAGGHHCGERQQPTGEELVEWARANTLPPGFEWVKQSYMKSQRLAQ